MSYQKMTQKRKTTRILAPALLLSFFLVFALFIFFITRPSELQVALKKVPQCSSVSELQGLWSAHPNLHDSTLANPIRARTLQLGSDSLQIAQVINFLPPRPKYINLIIVPDLSRRITDTINNPNQVESDKKILKAIYDGFESRVKFRGKTKDRLLIDLTDDGQASGQFRKIADSLLFDPFIAPEFVNRKYFERKIGTFPKYIDSLYSIALSKPLGADFHLYFSRELQYHLKKSDIFEEYQNILIIITDGYLEAEDKLYSGAAYQLAKVCKDWKDGMTLEASIDSSNLWIPPISEIIEETEVYLFEVCERNTGKNCDFDILKAQWKKWLYSMNVKNVKSPFFFQREDANAHIVERIRQIITD